MTTTTPQIPAASTPARELPRRGGMATRTKKKLTSPGATVAAILIAALWTVPTFGLLLSSFRPEEAIKTTGWWTFFGNPELTLQNYTEVLFSESSGSGQLAGYFINSLVITIPAVVIPTCLAAMAAYAFSWISFRGRSWLFVGVFALQIVPLQMALIPLLRLFSGGYSIAGVQVLPSLPGNTFLGVWIAHSIFALPLAIFLLHNFISEIPGEIMEAARVDGAGHGVIFRSIILPLSLPALASLGIFQFLWVWNDLLVALVFSGGTADVAPLTQRLAELSGSRGSEWQRLTAGAFVSIVVPLIVFFSLQRYFVRGMLAGGLKG